MELKLAQGFAVEVEAAAGDKPRRTITGIAVPYNVAATVTDGTTTHKIQTHLVFILQVQNEPELTRQAICLWGLQVFQIQVAVFV